MLVKCAKCSKEFERRPSRQRYINNYCSLECYGNAPTSKLVPCVTCGKPVKQKHHQRIRNDGRFCSRECYHKWTDKRIKIKCLNCGIELLKRRSSNRIFCSMKCRATYYSGVRSNLYTNGSHVSDGYDHLRKAHWFKVARHIRKRDSYSCVICKVHRTYRNRIRLDVHHVLPVTQGGTDDDSNLITLCRSCHSIYERRVDLRSILLYVVSQLH